MDKRAKTLATYKIFGSSLRGLEDVERMVAAVIEEKETVENLTVFADNLSVEWKYTEENISNLKLAFSKFEAKLELKKSEIIFAYAAEKEKRKVVASASIVG